MTILKVKVCMGKAGHYLLICDLKARNCLGYFSSRLISFSIPVSPALRVSGDRIPAVAWWRPVTPWTSRQFTAGPHRKTTIRTSTHQVLLLGLKKKILKIRFYNIKTQLFPISSFWFLLRQHFCSVSKPALRLFFTLVCGCGAWSLDLLSMTLP